MTLKLRVLKELWSDQKELRGELEALEADTQQLDQDINLLVWELRPTSLEDLSLQVALTKYTHNWSKHFGVHVELHARGVEKDPLPPEIVTTLYRIAQEALSNIAKHALATKVDVILECQSDNISLIIEDNGLGFEPDKISERGNPGFGLTGMRERAALVGGIVEIESRLGGGVTVIVRIPASCS
jgi:signal transduction histidine kinase